MKSFDTFYFVWYTFDKNTLQATFSYSFDHETYFTEIIDFSCHGFIQTANIDDEIMDTLLFHLSLAVGISYYKVYPTTNLVVETGSLDVDQQRFRTKFYMQGLGEFFYKNGISPYGLLHFVNGAKKKHQKIFLSSGNVPMIALWWGKDSLVSVELIKKMGIPFFTSTFGKDYYLHSVVGDSIWAPRLVIQRTFDPQLFVMNQQWYYNGHVPISWIIAFVLTTAAYLYDYTYIIMSNEKSANEGNILLSDEKTGKQYDINHQRSKSAEFESDFSDYIKKYISPDIKYFSLLRGMYEIYIAKLFAQYPQYFSVFSSCNNNFKVIEHNKTTHNRWCGICPKCAFVYTILRPFLSDDMTKTIFDHELYENNTLLPLYKELLGVSGIKPFECVGTNEEVTYAMYLYYQKIKNSSPLPPIIDFFKQEILPTISPETILILENKLFTLYTQETHIPKFFNTIFPL